MTRRHDSLPRPSHDELLLANGNHGAVCGTDHGRLGSVWSLPLGGFRQHHREELPLARSGHNLSVPCVCLDPNCCAPQCGRIEPDATRCFWPSDMAPLGTSGLLGPGCHLGIPSRLAHYRGSPVGLVPDPDHGSPHGCRRIRNRTPYCNRRLQTWNGRGTGLPRTSSTSGRRTNGPIILSSPNASGSASRITGSAAATRTRAFARSTSSFRATKCWRSMTRSSSGSI